MNLPMKEQLEQVYGKPRRRKPKKRRREDLSEFEIKSLMGANMRVHKKVKGRIRQI